MSLSSLLRLHFAVSKPCAAPPVSLMNWDLPAAGCLPNHQSVHCGFQFGVFEAMWVLHCTNGLSGAPFQSQVYSELSMRSIPSGRWYTLGQEVFG